MESFLISQLKKTFEYLSVITYLKVSAIKGRHSFHTITGLHVDDSVVAVANQKHGYSHHSVVEAATLCHSSCIFCSSVHLPIQLQIRLPVLIVTYCNQ